MEDESIAFLWRWRGEGSLSLNKDQAAQGSNEEILLSKNIYRVKSNKLCEIPYKLIEEGQPGP